MRSGVRYVCSAPEWYGESSSWSVSGKKVIFIDPEHEPKIYNTEKGEWE